MVTWHAAAAMRTSRFIGSNYASHGAGVSILRGFFGRFGAIFGPAHHGKL
jgi:hypothetical protein